jgi:hypothetical protein
MIMDRDPPPLTPGSVNEDDTPPPLAYTDEEMDALSSDVD